MDSTILMIINNSNCKKALVTLLSALECAINTQYKVILIDGRINKKNKRLIQKCLTNKAGFSFLKIKGIVQEDDIENLDLRKVKVDIIGNSIIFLQSNVLIRNDLSVMMKKYKNTIAAGLNIARDKDIDAIQKKKYDYGCIFFCTSKITEDIYSFKSAEGYDIIQNMDVTDYFYPHPMISLKEINSYLGKRYESFESIETSASVVRLYTSVETRLRKNNVFSREWCSYLAEIPMGEEKFEEKTLETNDRLKFIRKTTAPSKVVYKMLGITLIEKKITGGDYVIKIAKIPVIKKKTVGFYIYKYVGPFRIDKELNYQFIDSVLGQCVDEICTEIINANKMLEEKYTDKRKRIDIYDVKSMDNEIRNLDLYKLFNSIKTNTIRQEDEVRAGECYLNKTE